MRTDILEYLQKEVYFRCQQPTNRFGMGCYYHIEAVVKNSELLAEKYGADKEVVIIAAWLHDIASITNYDLYEMHHIHGAEMARDILGKFDYEEAKIALVQDCIRNHRGSVASDKTTIEELCVADADAISHFDSVPSLLYLAYVERKMSIEEGAQFVRNKLERSFRKLSPESKEYYQEKYQQVMGVLGKDELEKHIDEGGSVAFPDEIILLIEFLHPKDFYQLSIKGNTYEIIGKDDVGNFIGKGEDACVYYLDTELEQAMYIAPLVKTFVEELNLYQEYSNKQEKNIEEFKQKISELDSNTFFRENTFWFIIVEQMEQELL